MYYECLRGFFLIGCVELIFMAAFRYELGSFVLYCIVLYCMLCYAMLLLERISHLHKLNAHEIVTQQTAKNYVRQPGIEPGSTAWEAAMITPTPLSLQQFGRYLIYIYSSSRLQK